MDITLFENYDKEALQRVLQCNNIPYGENDEPEWKEQFKKSLKNFSKKRYNKLRGVEIKYTQPNKYGRYIAKNSLQIFQKDVRKYISGKYVYDLDFASCHPSILLQLFMKHEIYVDKFLKEYIENKDKATIKYKIKNKIEVIGVINNENAPTKQCYEKLHSNIYDKLLPLLLKDTVNKQLMLRVKAKRRKKNKRYNFNGGFIADFLQNIENKLLQSFYNYCLEENVNVESLFFDGLSVSKDSFELTEEFISNAEKYIFENTGYEIKIVSKPTDTDWIPIIDETNLIKGKTEEPDYLTWDTEHAGTLYAECFNDDGFRDPEKCRELIDYINNFVCLIDTPHSYGWRKYSNEKFCFRNESKIISRLGKKKFHLLNEFNNRLEYDKIGFHIDDKTFDPKVYNLYIRPNMNTDISIQIMDRCPTIFDFFLNIINKGDLNSYNFFINYAACMVQYGRTDQILLLRGLMGTGKGTLKKILTAIIGDEYVLSSSNLNTLSKQFNANMENKILVVIEEVPMNASNYHSIQQRIKDLTDTPKLGIERKGIDPYDIPNNINYIFNSNNLSPIKITEDNRRVMCMDVSTFQVKKRDYWDKIDKELKDNIEYLRHYFYTLNYNRDLNSIRPTTEAEKDLIQITSNPTEKYLNEFVITEDTAFTDIYDKYLEEEDTFGAKIFSKSAFKSSLRLRDYKIIIKEGIELVSFVKYDYLKDISILKI